MEIELRFKNSEWKFDLSESAMNTIDKKAQEGKELTPKLFKRYLISEHSPIRGVELRINLKDILVYTSVHFARHVHSIPYITTNRPDRRNKERSVDDTVNHMVDINCQGLIDMMRKRLCDGCCAEDTYNVALELKKAFMNSDDIYLNVLGKVLVPNCVYRGGCPEFKICKSIKNVKNTISISDRYNYYNDKLCGAQNG